MEKIQDANTFFCYEKIDEELYQVFLLPVSIVEKIKHQTAIEQTLIVPYQISIRNIINRFEPILFLHFLDAHTIIMTGLKGKEVSQVTLLPVQNLKETIKTSVKDFKTIFRENSLSIYTNNRNISALLEGIEVELISFPVYLPVKNTPVFTLPQHIVFQKALAERKQIKTISGVLLFAVFTAGTFFYTKMPEMYRLQQQSSLLQKQVKTMQARYIVYQQQNIKRLFTSSQKNEVISVFFRLSQLPPGYSFKTLQIEQVPAGYYLAEIFVSVVVPGMSPAPLQRLFPQGTIVPLFNTNGQVYKIGFTF